MSDVVTAEGLLEKLTTARAAIVRRYESNHDADDWRAEGDEGDIGLAATTFDIRRIESAIDRGRLALLDEAIARITADPTKFDVCQNPKCLGDGKIEHERLLILIYAKLCCACAAANERGGGSR